MTAPPKRRCPPTRAARPCSSSRSPSSPAPACRARRPRRSPPAPASPTRTCSACSARRRSCSSRASTLLSTLRRPHAAAGRRRGDRLEAMGRAYVDLLADREMLQLQLQTLRRVRRPRSRAGASRGYAELWQLVARLSGAPEEEVRFFATGMLLNLAAAMDLPQIAGDPGAGASPPARPGRELSQQSRAPGHADRRAGATSRSAEAGAATRPDAPVRASEAPYAAARSFADSASGAPDFVRPGPPRPLRRVSAGSGASDPSGSCEGASCSASVSASAAPAEQPRATRRRRGAAGSGSTGAAPTAPAAPASSVASPFTSSDAEGGDRDRAAHRAEELERCRRDPDVGDRHRVLRGNQIDLHHQPHAEPDDFVFQGSSATVTRELPLSSMDSIR